MKGGILPSTKNTAGGQGPDGRLVANIHAVGHDSLASQQYAQCPTAIAKIAQL